MSGKILLCSAASSGAGSLKRSVILACVSLTSFSVERFVYDEKTLAIERRRSIKKRECQMNLDGNRVNRWS